MCVRANVCVRQRVTVWMCAETKREKGEGAARGGGQKLCVTQMHRISTACECVRERNKIRNVYTSPSDEAHRTRPETEHKISKHSYTFHR